MPALYDPAQVERLIEHIDNLSKDIDDHKKALLKTDQRARNARVAAVVGMMVAVIGIAAGAWGINASRKAQDSVDAVEALTVQLQTDRTQARISSCIQANVERLAYRDANKDSLRALIPEGVAVTPTQQETLERYNHKVDDRLPFRDCSADGIKAYFETPPKDPALGG